MKCRVLSVLALLFAAYVAWPVAAEEPTTRPAGESPFSAEVYLEHIKYLASDELAGRRPGSPGIEEAAKYIVEHFQAAGLEPAGEEGTWFQEFEVRRGKQLVDEDALLEIDGLERKWKVREDWIPLPFTEMEDVEGPLAFAGYGIKAELHNYNDYADFDPEGKILLILRYEPRGDDPEADFGGESPSHYSQFRGKAHTAARRGARALLIVNPPKRAGVSDELYPFSEEWSRQTYDLPLVHITPELAEVILKKAKLPTLEKLQERLDRERKPLSTDLHLNVKLKTGVRENKVKTRNVLGLLKGEGGTDETIVFGAHYDHLGLVPLQFERKDEQRYIHNGADDNASGSAAIMELARVLGRERGLRRNLLFITFSAEEMGLLGSKYFVVHPTVKLEDVKAMINIDMIGRLSQDRFTIFGIPSAKEFDEIVGRAAERVDLDYRAPKALSGNSDHASFFYNKIPYLFPFTGIHKQYHRPGDDWELIDAPGAVKILSLLRLIARELADLEEGPAFQEEAAESEPEEEDLDFKPAVEHEKDAQKAKEKKGEEKPVENGAGGMPSRPPVRFGIIPDFSADDKPGVVADTVLDGGPAQAAQMKSGDRIIRIGDYKVNDIYGYMDALKHFKPGDQIDVIVVRQDQEITLQIKLQKSRRRPGRE
ncbi:MAG: M28 family peptidase [Phycisphaerae bacterium]|nr:M28 family peptidase [Phycisphaerae bacterium]